MKKLLSGIMLIIIITLLPSCAHNIAVENSYIPLSTATNSVYVTGSYVKKGKSSINRKVFASDAEYKFHYNETLNGNYCSLDYYRTAVELNDHGNICIRLYFDTKTGKLVKYKNDAFNDQPDVPSLTLDSTENEFIDYAKKVFLENAGVSVDGWEIKYEIGPNGNRAIDFYKTIGGIVRSDQMYIYMTSTGKIIEYVAISGEKQFKPFENVIIDRNELENKIYKAFSTSIGKFPYYIISEKIADLELVVKDNTLWASAFVEFEYCNIYYSEDRELSSDTMTLSSGVWYAVKIAENK